MPHLRRFLVVLMKRIAHFCHSQQLVVPIIFFVVFGIWQFFIKTWSWEEFRSNLWTPSFPYVTTTLLFLGVQIVLAARDLNKELAIRHETDKPRIVGGEHLMRPASKVPGRTLGSVFVFFVLLLEALALRAAYPGIRLHVPQAPITVPKTNTSTAASAPIVPDKKPPKRTTHLTPTPSTTEPREQWTVDYAKLAKEIAKANAELRPNDSTDPDLKLLATAERLWKQFAGLLDNANAAIMKKATDPKEMERLANSYYASIMVTYIQLYKREMDNVEHELLKEMPDQYSFNYLLEKNTPPHNLVDIMGRHTRLRGLILAYRERLEKEGKIPASAQVEKK